MPVPTIDREQLDERLVAALASHSYEQVSDQFGVSRGRVYAAAVRLGARKHEARITERALDGKRRRREFLEAVLNAVETCDVLDFLDGLPNDSVDLHVTSFPYNIGKRYGGGGADAMRHHYYLGWCLQVLSEMERTVKPGGVIAINLGLTFDNQGRMVPLDTLFFSHLQSMGLTFQNRVAWIVPHGLTPAHRLSGRYETILIFSKGPRPATFNATPVRTPQQNPAKRAFKGPRRGEISSHPLGAWPSDVWVIPNVGHRNPERRWNGGHPAQFPEAIPRRAIMLYTNPGDLVVDVFQGTGSSAAVAKRCGRAFTGCDLFYADSREERLAAVEPDLVSILPGVSDESVEVWQAEARARQFPAQPATQAQIDAEAHAMQLDLLDDASAAAA